MGLTRLHNYVNYVCSHWGGDTTSLGEWFPRLKSAAWVEGFSEGINGPHGWATPRHIVLECTSEVLCCAVTLWSSPVMWLIMMMMLIISMHCKILSIIAFSCWMFLILLFCFFLSEWILRFVLGPSLHADNIRMFTNHPQSRSEVFKRQVFRELKWSSACNMKNDRHDSYIDIQLVIPGSFNYYFTIDGRSVLLYILLVLVAIILIPIPWLTITILLSYAHIIRAVWCCP